VNAVFAALRRAGLLDQGRIGLCLDVGHANLHRSTRHDYLGFLDRIDPDVPIVHLHLHENLGDRDSHLTVFTGPAGRDPAGVASLLARLQRRGFAGCIILEQWPDPPELLVSARHRLLAMLQRKD
jgi:sugar phosphate isomerase/epimerase